MVKGVKVLKKVIFSLIAAALVGSAVNAMEVQINIEYGKIGSESLLLDIYTPKAEGAFPAVIIVHGGGWMSGDKRRDITGLFEPIADSNMVCYSINHRLAPANRWPAAYDDVRSAVKWVKANALKYKTDPNRIALAGFSSGAQLAMLAAMKAYKETDVQAAVGLAAPTDLVAESLRRGDVTTYITGLFGTAVIDSNMVQQLWDISPINHTRSGMMPVLLVHGTNDNSVPYQQALNFKKRVEDVGGICGLITINGGPHNIAEWSNFDAEYPQKIVQWLKQTLHKK